MKSRFIAAAVLALQLAAWPALGASALKTLDTDNDGTLDLSEVKAGATAEFDKLDKDNDGTLDKKELKGRIAKKDWPSFDPDSDGTVSKDEYLAGVETVFKRANADNDGTLSAKELQTPNGQAALRLAR